jgi:hypothetical protein
MKLRRLPKICAAASVSLGITLTAWSQTSLSINNAGFEDPVLSSGGFSSGVPDWTRVGSGSEGVLHPASGDYSGGAPEGNNVASVVAGSSGDGISQILSDPDAVLKEGSQYTLTVQVGNSGSFDYEGYQVQLLADGVVLAEDVNSQSPAVESFELVTVVYDYDAGSHSAQLGEPLEIRLLSTANASGETNFDDVQLTVAMADPVAEAGGPYDVFPGGSLELDGSESAPSAGETITAYDWDLDNNGSFGDVTGEQPAAISRDDLINVWGMAEGPNTIQLRVTDSAAKTATATATVNLKDNLVIMITDTEPAGAPIETFFTENFTNIAEIRHGNYADFAAQATQDALNGTGEFADSGPADIVVVGRGLSSGEYNEGASTGYNALEIPVVNFTSYTARSLGDRLGWHGSSAVAGISVAGDETTVTAEGAAFLGLPAGTYDLNEGGSNEFNGLGVGTDTYGEGEILATIGGNTLAAYWAAGSAPGDPTVAGVATFPAARLLYNVDNPDFTEFTPQGLEAMIAAVGNATPLAPAPFELVSLDPENGESGVNPSVGELNLTFSKDIQLTGSGTITLQDLDDGSSDLTIPLPDAAVSVDGKTLTIALASDLEFDTAYAVQITGDALTTLTGTAFAGISDNTTWAFTSAVQNLNPPVITDQSPADQEGTVSLGTDIVVTFDQGVEIGTGNIVIKDLLDDSSTQTIDVTDATQVTAENNVLTVSPATGLSAARSYAVLIDSTAVRNYSDVGFAGISDDSAWTFSTASLVSQLGILDLGANGGVNPATQQGWQAGDSYRLVFISSTYVDPNDAAKNDISAWNTAVQNIADAATTHDLSGVTWKIIGSTENVDARDNTLTNPEVNGTGHAIFNMDGSSVIENNFVDLWNGDDPVNIALFDENVVDKDTSAAVDWPLTGTNFDGTANSSLFLKDTTGGGAIRQGRNQAGFSAAWIDANNVGANWSANDALSVYGMSERLFVIDQDDATAPTFVSFADDVGGGPVNLNDSPVVNYTVTFDEAILPGTVEASDFSNAGDAGVTIDSIVQQEDPAVFVVGVAPTSTGSLQLQINAGAAMTDLNGNALDTSTGFIDGTTITVESAGGFDAWSGGGLLPDGDANNDGVENAVAWVLGAADPSANAIDLLPTLDNESDPDYALFTFERVDEANDDPNTTISVEYSSDLGGSWTTAVDDGDNVLIEVTDGSPADTVVVKLKRATLATGNQLFLRLNVAVSAPAP